MCLFATCISFLVTYLFMSFAHFLVELFGFFLLLNFQSSLCILDTSPLSDMWLANIFSHSVTHPVVLFNRIFHRAEIFNFAEISLLSLWIVHIVSSLKIYCLALDPEVLLPCFSLDFKKYFINLFVYLFLASLGLCCCMCTFSSCGERELLFWLWCVVFLLRWFLLL